MLLEEPLDLLGGDERLIPGEDDKMAAATGLAGRGSRAKDRVARREHGRAGALPLDLLDDLDALGKPLGNSITRPDDRQYPLRAGLPRRVDDPPDKRPTGDPMQHLRHIGPHPSALAGGHDEDRKRRGHGLSRVPTPAPQAASASRSYHRIHLRTALSLTPYFRPTASQLMWDRSSLSCSYVGRGTFRVSGRGTRM
jgi:hypothetical protein